MIKEDTFEKGVCANIVLYNFMGTVQVPALRTL